MGNNPAAARVKADLAAPAFRAGVRRGFWRVVEDKFPVAKIAVAATEPDGVESEYMFRFEMTGYPATAPQVLIWDDHASCQLTPDRRPKGPARVIEAFKPWGEQGVYRPWERQGVNHNNWSSQHPELAWNAARDLAFIMEDLHALLNLNATAYRLAADA